MLVPNTLMNDPKMKKASGSVRMTFKSGMMSRSIENVLVAQKLPEATTKIAYSQNMWQKRWRPVETIAMQIIGITHGQCNMLT